jgi:UDP-4-amino-4,6-dideoxy-N-acetyl-beta-L-altrosamine N-acetyltransferase
MSLLIPFEALNMQEKEMVLSWRNDKNIRKWMYNKEKIQLKDHLSFIEALNSDQTKKYFLVREEGRDIGVIDLCQISEKTAHGGLYQNPKLKGFGTLLLREMIRFAFEELGVKKLFLEAFEENERAIKLYKKMGFIEIKHAMFNKKKLVSLELKHEDR